LRKSKSRKNERVLRGKAVEKLNKELCLKRREARLKLVEKYPNIFKEQEKTLPIKEMQKIILERVQKESVDIGLEQKPTIERGSFAEYTEDAK